MTGYSRVLADVLKSTSDANISFFDLCHLLERLGFLMRVRSSHHIFTMQGIEEIVNLQPKGGKAKPYQVKQVRSLIRKYKIGESDVGSKI